MVDGPNARHLGVVGARLIGTAGGTVRGAVHLRRLLREG